MAILDSLLKTACRFGVAALLCAACLPASAQQSLTREHVKAKFEAANPVLKKLMRRTRHCPVHLARIELQRVQYQSEIETAVVNLRTESRSKGCIWK
jgi:hypothetical protein